MNQINKLTNVNALKLSHASVQTQKTDESFSTLLKEELDRSEGVRFQTCGTESCGTGDRSFGPADVGFESGGRKGKSERSQRCCDHRKRRRLYRECSS